MREATQKETTVMKMAATLASTRDIDKAVEDAIEIYGKVIHKLERPPLVTSIETSAPADDDDIWGDDAWGEDEEEKKVPKIPSIWDADVKEQFDALPSQGRSIFPKFGPAVMKEVSSSNISSMGHSIVVSGAKPGEFVVSLFLQFKGGDYYRYDAVPLQVLQELMKQAVESYKGNPDASVGSNFHHLVKVPADEGVFRCWKLKDRDWVEVLPKSERTKELKKRATK